MYKSQIQYQLPLAVTKTQILLSVCVELTEPEP